MYQIWDYLDAPWGQYSDYIGKPAEHEEALFPDFLIIGPHKTGTTWLTEVLRGIGDIFIPSEKEMYYFDYNWRHTSLSEYLTSFNDHIEEVKGDATPTYHLLPSFAISAISNLNPKLKIICLLRHPVDRAWSQLKHCRKLKDDTFRYSKGEIVSKEEMLTHLMSDYNRSGNDYLEILARWEKHLPKESIFVDYFENATTRPIAFFERLVRFLGSNVPTPWDQIEVHRARNVGDPEPMPEDIRWFLLDMYAPWIEGIKAHLQKEYGLNCPWDVDETDKYHWPVWIRDATANYHVGLDRAWFVAIEKDGAREITRRAYLSDLLRELQDVRCKPIEPKKGVGRDCQDPNSPRLIALLEGINLDRLVRLQRDWFVRGARIHELQDELEKRDATIKRLHGELAAKAAEIPLLHNDWTARGERIRELQDELEKRDATIKRLHGN